MTTTESIDLGQPITTSRLVLRASRMDDAGVLTARRNQPLAEQFVDWPYPYPHDRAVEQLTVLAERTGPTAGKGWMLIIDTGTTAPDGRGDGEINVGDVAVFLDDSGTIAEIGYNVNPESHGLGYATEAVAAVVARLFERESRLQRIEARMHPENIASAMVAERCGFLYEGRPRLACPPSHDGQVQTDDLVYGLIRADLEAWDQRPVGPPADVSLVEVTVENLDPVYDLAVHHSQERLVAPVSFSLSQAAHPRPHNGRPVEAWYRAVVADGDVAGFVMLALQPDEAPYLWRMLIDRRHQRRGIGRRVLDLVVDEARRQGGNELTVSWMPGPGSPEPFYLGYGFRPTGEPDGDGEIPGILSI